MFNSLKKIISRVTVASTAWMQDLNNSVFYGLGMNNYNNRDSFQTGATYAVNDYVVYPGYSTASSQLYICISPVVSASLNPPSDPAHWALFSVPIGSVITQTVANVAALRALVIALAPAVTVLGYSTSGDGGGGTFTYVSTDTTSSDNGGTIIVDALGRRWYRQFSGDVDVRYFGATGKGVSADDTPIANAMAYAFGAGKELFFSAGTYLLSASIKIQQFPGFKMRGDSRGGTTLQQGTDNTPIFEFQVTDTHSWTATDFNFTWTNNQPAANNKANAFFFSASNGSAAGWYNFSVERITFNKGYMVLRNDTSKTRQLAWGFNANLIVCGTLTSGGVAEIVSSPSNGQPSINFGQMYVRCDGMAAQQAVLKLDACDQFTVQHLELNGGTDIVAMSMTGGCRGHINCMKIEAVNYSAAFAGNRTVIMSDTHIVVDYYQLINNTINVGGGAVMYCFGTGSGGTSYLHCLETYVAPNSVTGNVYFVQSSDASHQNVLDHIIGFGSGVSLANIAASSGPDFTTISDYIAPRVSADNGDASVALTMGTSAQTQRFNTQLTANRVVTLPSVGGGTNAFNGLAYEIVRNAATPGAFTLQIQTSTSAVVATIPINTNGRVRVEWRRVDGWIVTDAALLQAW